MKFGLSDSVIEELQSVFRRYSEIEKVLIFASRAKGNFRAGSDIDFAAVGTHVNFPLILSVLSDIDDLGLLYSVGLIDYKKAQGTPIGQHIDRVGQVFYQA